MPNLTLLGTLKRVLPAIPGEQSRRLTLHARRRLMSGAESVRGAVEMYEPCVELDMARLRLIEAEMWIQRAHAIP